MRKASACSPCWTPHFLGTDGAVRRYFLDFLGYRSRLFESILHPPPLKLVDNGKLLRRNMRREFITEAELMSHLREKGMESFDQVKAAFMEGDGEISVIRKE